MARQSRWQQFADNFNSVYGSFTTAAKNFEAAKVMKNDFKDESGVGLSGAELDRARYKALADIYTKYGDAAGGLALRANQAALESNIFNNDLNAATKGEQTYLRGKGAVADLNAGIGQKNASAASSMATANRTSTLTPLEAASYGLANDQAAFDLGLSKETRPSTVAKARADAEKAEADAEVAKGTVGPKIASEKAGARQAGAEADTAEITAAETSATSAARIESTLQELKAAAAEAGNRAQTAETVMRDQSIVSEIVGQATSMDFGSTEAANSWIVDQLSKADISPQMRYETAKTINAHGIEVIGARAAEISQRAKAAYDEGGLDAVADMYDNVKDGVDAKVVREGDTVSVVRTFADGRTDVVAHAQGPEAEATVTSQAMQMLLNPMSAMQMAASELDLRAKGAEVAETESRTSLIDLQQFSETLDQDETRARTALVNAQADKTQVEIDTARVGLSGQREIALKGLANMMSDPSYLMLKDSNPEAAQRAQLDYMLAFGLVKSSGAATSAAPEGMTQDVWDAMSEEDKALFR